MAFAPAERMFLYVLRGCLRMTFTYLHGMLRKWFLSGFKLRVESIIGHVSQRLERTISIHISGKRKGV
jgi:hypothetical protein